MTESATRGGGTSIDLSVVIPNLDGAHWLEPCLASIDSDAQTSIEIVVADDGSTDASAATCARFGARFILAPRARTGFAATANRGIRVASGTWILLLNNDTELAPGAVGALLETAGRHPDAAMIAPFVLSLRDRVTIDSAGMLIFPDGTARPRWHGTPASSVPLRGEEEVLVPSGAAAMIRADWLDRVGLLDEGMTSYLEDIDLGLRIRRAGGGAVFSPDAVVYHHFSGTTGALSPEKARLIERNHMTVAARHLPIAWLIGLPFWTFARWVTLVRTVLASRAPGGSGGSGGASVFETGRSVLGGFAAGVLRLPTALRQRRSLQQHAAVGGREWQALLRSHRARLADFRRFGAEA